MLSITREQFDELYPDLIGHYDFFNNPVPAGISAAEFERVYLRSKLWRLNNIYTIIDKNGQAVPFVMNLGQHKVYARSRQHPRVLILKSRQQGISTFWLVSYFDDAQFGELLKIGMMAQGKAEARTLLERSEFLWDNLSPAIKQFLGVNRIKNNSDEQGFDNNCQIFIRTSFRSTTLHRLHVSEMGKIANQYPQRAKEVKTGTLQALGRGMTGVIESTAEGLNMFYEMWCASEVALYSGSMSAKDFYPVFLSWLDDPDCWEEVDQEIDEEARVYFEELEAKLAERYGREYKLTKQQKNFWIVQRRELGGDVFQEYPATPDEAFTASRDGTYWGRQFQEEVVRGGKVRDDVYDPNLPVDVYLDIGVEDYCVLVFRQWYRGEYRIVDEYFNQNYTLRHYMEEAMSRGYNVRSIRFPHDVAVREFASGGHGGLARSRLDIAREIVREEGWDIYVDYVAKSSFADGVENVRRAIPNMVVDKKCVYLIKCFQRFTKEWDEKLQAWKRTEVHDEWSHGAAALRYMCTDTIELDSLHSSKMSQRAPVRRSSGYAL